MARKPTSELTWTRAIIYGLVITWGFVIFLGWIPSYFIYWWGSQTQNVINLIHKVFNYTLKDPYTTVRIRDAIAMGFETNVIVVALVAAYIIGERKRRRQGQRGAEDVKGYMPGK
jgi:hypothetical protein